MVAAGGVNDNPRASRSAFVRWRMGHICRDVDLLAVANVDATFQVLAIINGAIPFQQIRNCFDATVIMRVRASAVRHRQYIHANVLSANRF